MTEREKPLENIVEKGKRQFSKSESQLHRRLQLLSIWTSREFSRLVQSLNDQPGTYQWFLFTSNMQSILFMQLGVS